MTFNRLLLLSATISLSFISLAADKPAQKKHDKQKVLISKDRTTGEEFTRDAATLMVNGKEYVPSTLTFEAALQSLHDLEMSHPSEIYCTPKAEGADKTKFTLEYLAEKGTGNGDFTAISGAKWKSDEELKSFDTKSTPDKASFGNVKFEKAQGETLSEMRARVLENYDANSVRKSDDGVIGNWAFSKKAIANPEVVIKFEADLNTETAVAHPYSKFDYEARLSKTEYKYYRKGLDRIGSKRATRFPNAYINNFCEGVVDMYNKLGLKPKDGVYTLKTKPKGEQTAWAGFRVDYYSQFDITAP